MTKLKIRRGYYFYPLEQSGEKEKLYYIGTNGVSDNQYIPFLRYKYTKTFLHSSITDGFLVFSCSDVREYGWFIEIDVDLMTDLNVAHFRKIIKKKNLELIHCVHDEQIQREFDIWINGIEVPDELLDELNK